MASPISTGTLNLLKGLSESVMLDTVTLRRQGARITKPAGGWEYGAATDIVTQGKIGPVSKTAIERLQADNVKYSGMEELRIPLGVPASDDDSVVVQSARHSTTRTYTIEAVVPLDTFSVSQSLILKAVP